MGQRWQDVESRGLVKARAAVGVVVTGVTVLLCLQVLLHHSVIGAFLPTMFSTASVLLTCLGGLAPLYIGQGRSRRLVSPALEKAVEVARDWLLFTMVHAVLFACAVVMQFNTGHGRASSVYYQAFALSAIGMGSCYGLVMYLATIYYPFERRVSWVWVQTAILLVVLVVLLHWERDGRMRWHTGLHLEGVRHSGKIEPGASKCQIGLDYWRLRYAFPKRFFNLWAGSMQCDSSRRPRAELQLLPDESGRQLMLECGRGEEATYVEDYPFLRSTSQWIKERFPAKRVEASEHAVAVVKTYDAAAPPVITGQHVQAFCGNREAALLQAVPPQIRTAPRPKKKKLNVVLVMIDAVARAEFHHSLPETAAKLEELNNSPLHPFSVFEFFRYQTIGKTTQPNLTGLLSGMSQPMRERYVEEWRKGKEKAGHSLGLIFRQFKKEHQRAMFPHRELDGHDYTTGLVLGFCNSQLEDYWNTTAEEQLLDVQVADFFCHNDFTGETLDNPFKGPYSSSKRCIAGKSVHSYVFDVMDSMLENSLRPNSNPAFVKSELLEGHETSLEVLSVIDTDLADFLDGVSEKYPDSFVMLYSDHGNHMTMLSNYPGGRQEQGLGTLFTIVPNWVLDDHPSFLKNLEDNQQKIVTTLDMYSTLLDLSVLYGPAPEMPPKTSTPHKWFTTKLDRASDGLLRPLDDRNCKTARVPSTRCRCE